MSEFIGNLRSEIVESEKARIDLLKWKIILIAGLGTVGFGIGKEPKLALPVLLGFIPLVCAYVDVLCVHNDLRILVIAHFLRTNPEAKSPEARSYEKLCNEQRRTFVLEDFALVGTTATFSVLVALFSLPSNAWNMFVPGGEPISNGVKWFLGASTALGLAVSIGATLFRIWRRRRL